MTAEFATVLPAVMVVALLLLSLVRLVGVSIGCQDAASAAVRAAIASGDETDPASAARAVVGKGVSVDVSMAERRVTVVARCPVIPDPQGVLPTVVEGKAVGVLS
ncbi:TadE family type IV pilus minor pilin [Bifidobacterium pongonis]|uniref:TadE family type IV pilus minor pilin n=1 Tax=Bifidobacterium pongonis TaxID=2834432 RepID=UPI00308403A9